jgi:hypothetical protein
MAASLEHIGHVSITCRRFHLFRESGVGRYPAPILNLKRNLCISVRVFLVLRGLIVVSMLGLCPQCASFVFSVQIAFLSCTIFLMNVPKSSFTMLPW